MQTDLREAVARAILDATGWHIGNGTRDRVIALVVARCAHACEGAYDTQHAQERILALASQEPSHER